MRYGDLRRQPSRIGRRLRFLLLFCSMAALLSCAGARIEPVTDGNPFRHLEELDSPSTIAWVQLEDAESRRWLSKAEAANAGLI